MADEPEELDEAVAEILAGRGADLARRKDVREKLIDLYRDVEKGFDEQFERANDNMDHWDMYNCKLGQRQFYSGNSQIFVPIVRNAVEARVTRFTNQIFPQSGRYVETVTQDGAQPHAITALLEYYVRKARMRSAVRKLLRNGDVEGQYTVYVSWAENERHVVRRVKRKPETEDGLPAVEDEDIDDIEEETVKHGYPIVEVIADADIVVLPATSDNIEEAIQNGGSVTILRRWGKAKLNKMIDAGEIDKKAGKQLIGELNKDTRGPRPDKAKAMVDAAGVKGDGRGKYALVYETWSKIKTPDGYRLCKIFFAGGDKILSCKRNPLWSDKLPLISSAAKEVQGAFKGQSQVAPCVDMQIYANDTMNQAADSASYSMMPIIMTDPAKNPKVGSMVLNMAAIWETSPNDTQFAKFPQLWKDGLEIVAAAKSEIFQTLSVNPASMSMAAGKKKQSQAEIANEQQVDILTTADAVVGVEENILTPLLARMIELDHQYRDKPLLVQQFGDMGARANMQEIPPVQFDKRYQFKWLGVESARNAQRMQQQIAFLNVVKGTPPQLYPGYKLNLGPLLAQMVENVLGPRIGPLTFEDIRQQVQLDPQIEVELAKIGTETPVHPLGDHAQALQLLMKALNESGDPSGVIKVQMIKHAQAQAEQVKAQSAAQGMPGGPGGAGPGVAGTPRQGAQPGQPRGGQNPPGMVSQDRLQDPRAMPRRMG